MNDRSLLESAPADWTIDSFSTERATGTLRRGTGEAEERASFAVEAWSSEGFAGSTWPIDDEPVHVTWRVSRMKTVVPGRVVPTSRPAETVEPGHTLKAWLKAIQRHGQFVGLTPKTLLRALAELDEEAALAWDDGEERTGEDFGILLQALAHAPAEKLRERSSWVYSDDHRWDRESATRALLAGFSAAGASTTALPAPLADEANESLAEYVARCNAAAAAAVSWHAISSDEETFVLLDPEAFAALVAAGYLAVD